jgi:hypothetical protein
MLNDNSVLAIRGASQIVTHPGEAHRDEFMACCLLLTVNPDLMIYRKMPSEAQLGSLSTIVVDVGEDYDPLVLNFDHHQAPDLDCSLILVLRYLGVAKKAHELFTWLEATDALDRSGPKGLAKHLECPPDRVPLTVSPIEITVLRWFGSCTMVTPGSELHRLMFRIGDEKIAYIDKVEERLQLIDRLRQLWCVNGVTVLDARAVAKGNEDPILGIELYCQRNVPKAGIVINYDDRGPGLSLYRRQDNPMVDFRRIIGKPGVHFVHNNGFIAKTDAGLTEQQVYALVEAATADPRELRVATDGVKHVKDRPEDILIQDEGHDRAAEDLAGDQHEVTIRPPVHEQE